MTPLMNGPFVTLFTIELSTIEFIKSHHHHILSIFQCVLVSLTSKRLVGVAA